MWLKAENELKLYANCTKLSYAIKMSMENDEKMMLNRDSFSFSENA